MISCNSQQLIIVVGPTPIIIIGIGPVWFFSFWILTTAIFYLSQNTGKPTFENVVGKICSQGKPEFHCLHLHTVHLYD